jgi:hypothetical protein
MSYDNNAASFLLVSVLRQRKKVDFSLLQNVVLVVRSQYRYKLISKIFKPSKVPSIIYILSCTHISFKINKNPIQTTPPPRGWTASPGGGGHSLRTSGLNNIFLHLYIIQFIADPNLLLRELNSRADTIYRVTNVGAVKTDILHIYITLHWDKH